MTDNILNYWPFAYDPRKNQELALPWLAENQDKKYLILEAPVGAGKSNIGLAYSLFRGSNAFVLTPQRILQEQYEQSFYKEEQIDLASFYGKSNYTCRDKNSDCSVGSLVKPRCKNCPYTIARNKAIQSNNTVMNYKLGLSIWAFTNLFRYEDDTPKKRKLMILDECHTLEEHLVNFDALVISEWRCKKYNVQWKPQESIEDAVEYLQKTYIPAFNQVIEDLRSELELIIDKDPSDLTKTDLKKLKELAGLEEHIFEGAMAYNDVKELEDKFVLVHDATMFEFRRLSGAHAFNAIIKPMADQFLFMSSTVLNKEGFCRDLGINPDDAAFLSLPSEFAVENRPVYYMPQMKMNYKWTAPENKAKRNGMINSVKKLLEMHDGQSGIIHTGNFKIAEWLVDELQGSISQQIYHHNPNSGDDRNAIIRAFTSSPKPGVLISPSCTEGLDLKDDQGRYAIFVKIPFGSLGDQWIKKRMEMSGEWYKRRALIDVIQGGGRVVRGPEDDGSLYILDESFGYLFSQTASQIPQWWKDSYTKI